MNNRLLTIFLILTISLALLCGCAVSGGVDPDQQGDNTNNGDIDNGNSNGNTDDTDSNDNTNAVQYNVHFDIDYGTSIDDMTTSSIDTMPESMRSGYNLVGWYSDIEYNDKVIFPYTVTSDITLYPLWQAYTDGLSMVEVDGCYSVVGRGSALDNGVTTVVVPSHYNNLPVVSIADQAFMASSLTSVVLPYTVASTGSWSFGGCSSLSSVTLPDYLDSIGMGAFYNDTKLTSITLPEGLTTISKSAFGNCTGLTEVVVPDSVSYLGDSAFSFCSNLATVTLPTNLENIGAWLLSGSSISYIDIPDTVTYIGDYAFSNCTNLTAVTLPASLEKISACAFMGCSNLASVVFGNTVGWYVTYSYLFVDGDAVNTSDPALNASRLVSVDNYYNYNWYRVE